LSRTGEERYRKLILLKLSEHAYWGGRHTSEDTVFRGFPPRDHKRIEKEYRKLVREGYFIRKPKADGVHVSLNPGMRNVIEVIIAGGGDGGSRRGSSVA
jgi:hypothetical protein